MTLATDQQYAPLPVEENDKLQEQLKEEIETDKLFTISLSRKLLNTLIKIVIGGLVLLGTSFLSFKTGFAVAGG